MTRKDLRDKDREVLHQIAAGNNDVQKITEATNLENHEVNYCFTKLEDLDLIQVDKPDGMIERVINGQKRVFQAPKQAQLTGDGTSLLEQTESRVSVEHDYSRVDLADRICELENQVQELEDRFEMFRKQMLKKR